MSQKYLRKRKFSGFTLVELIVVITILAILGIIAFLSLQGFSSSARDATRIENLSNLHKGLSLFQVRAGTFPLPEGQVNITASGANNLIGYQGFTKEGIADMTKLSGAAVKDPLNPNMYTTYSVNANQTSMQIMTFLENGNTSLAYIPTVFASESSDYSQRTPTTRGDTLGILLASGTLQPIQEAGSGVDVINTSTGYVVVFSKAETIFGTGNNLFTYIYNHNTGLIRHKAFASLDPTLVGYWDMETLTGGRLKDFSKYENNGTCMNSGSSTNCGAIGQGPQSINGNNSNGKALYFDGVDDWIQVNKANFLTLPTNDFSVVSLIKTNQNILQRCIISTSGDGVTGFRYGYSQSWVYYLYGGHTEGLLMNGKIVNDNTVHHLVSNYHLGKKITSYVDGVYSSTIDISGWNYGNKGALNQSQYVFIGTMNYGNGGNINGILDEVRIYNRILSDSEVATLYNATK